MRNVKVLSHIDKVRQPLVDAEGITFESHLKRLKELGAAAEKANQHSAAVTAEVWRGRAAGLYADRVRQEDLDKLTEDELEMVTRGKVPPRLKLA